MTNSAALAVLTACLAAGLACSGATAPSPLTSSTAGVGISFSGLTTNGAAVTVYTESAFNISPVSGDWSVRTDYGNPAPFVQFWAPGGSTVTGEIQVRASRSLFYFKSVDVYSSTTPIPYTINGFRNGRAVFTVTDTVPNTFGNFRTIENTKSADAIDTLSIALTNAAAPCCRNPMGLDTIVLTSTPSTPPVVFSLSGQVTDRATGAGIPGARVSIMDGPNAGKSARTDGSGTYSFTALQQSGFTVRVSADTYVSESRGVTLTSNQTLSFQLTPQPSTPPAPGTIIISFNGLAANRAPVATYAESGFTVSTTSGAWEAITTYGNPAPFIQFAASSGTTVAGEAHVTASGSTFTFRSVDLYSSTTPIPYTIRGLRSGRIVFTVTNTIPNTFGQFRTVVNPEATDVIDTLSIALTNAAAPCCGNPMGFDTIVLGR